MASALAIAALAPSPAAADGLAELPTPRAIGRAGAGLVSDDGGGAVLANPAGMARRDTTRVQVGGVAVDHDLSYRSAQPAAPDISDAGAPALAPLVAAQTTIGPLVVGAAYATTAQRERRLPVPRPDQSDADVVRLFPHRYAGLSSTVKRRTAAAAAAVRATDWLAVGLTVSLSRAELDERRRLWAGFGGRDPLASASRDVELGLDGVDAVVPAAGLGALIAPASAPLEIALAASWSDDVDVDGDAAASADGTPQVSARRARARTEVAAPLLLRAGVRWLGERWAAEVGGDLWILPGGIDRPRWRVDGLDVIDDTGLRAPIDDVPSLLAQRSHGALRAAIDAEVLAGFVWLTAGWAWSGAATPADRQTPAFADLGGHTAALGVEIATGGITVTAGWSRLFGTTRWAEPGAVPRENPFDAGTEPANTGRYQGSRDVIGVAVELALE